MTRVYGADLIVLRACDQCGEWPYLHKPGCPVKLRHEREIQERVVEPILRAERERV